MCTPQESELVYNMRGICNTEHAVLVKEEKVKKRLDSWSHNIFNLIIIFLKGQKIYDHFTQLPDIQVIPQTTV